MTTGPNTGLASLDRGRGRELNVTAILERARGMHEKGVARGSYGPLMPKKTSSSSGNTELMRGPRAQRTSRTTPESARNRIRVRGHRTGDLSRRDLARPEQRSKVLYCGPEFHRRRLHTGK